MHKKILIIFCSFSLFLTPLAAEQSSQRLKISADAFKIEFFDPTAATISTALTYTTLALPGLLLLEDQDSPWALPIAYGTAIGTTYLLKSTLKLLIDKRRPQPYIDTFGIDDDDVFDSFPSGHTALSFAAAAFTAVAYAKDHSESSVALVVPAISLALSSMSGTLRYTSGSHYPIDIFAGVLIGAVTGGLCAYLLY